MTTSSFESAARTCDRKFPIFSMEPSYVDTHEKAESVISRVLTKLVGGKGSTTGVAVKLASELNERES